MKPLAMAPRPVAGDPRPGLSGLDDAALVAWLDHRGELAYRARQLQAALWRGTVASAAGVTTLSRDLGAAVAADFRWSTVEDDRVVEADGGQTEKTLHRLADGLTIESVLMHYPARPGQRARHTLCISSQAGCAVGCPFCATGELGFERDLSTAEILDQVRSAVARLAKREDGAHVTNVVFMGMGEPLLNLDRVLEAVAALNDPNRLGLGARHITVSTSGVVPGISRFPPQAWCPGSVASPRSGRSSRWPSPCTRRVMPCVTSSSRSTVAGRSPRSWPPPAITRRPPVAGSATR